MKSTDYAPGEQTAAPMDHAATGIRVRVYHEKLRWGAYHLSKSAELAANIALELEDDEETRVQWVGTGTLHADHSHGGRGPAWHAELCPRGGWATAPVMKDLEAALYSRAAWDQAFRDWRARRIISRHSVSELLRNLQ